MGTISGRNHPLSEEMIDATLADSFPASDPPSWTLGRDRYQEEPANAIMKTSKTNNDLSDATPTSSHPRLQFVLITLIVLALSALAGRVRVKFRNRK